MSGTVIMNLSFQVRMREGRVDRKTGSGAVYRVFDQSYDTMNGHSPVTPEPATPAYVPSLTHTHHQLHIQHSAVWCLIIRRLGRLYGHAYFFALLIIG